MVRLIAVLLVAGFCLGAGLGCGISSKAHAPSPIPNSKIGFAVEGMKQGDWQVVAAFPNRQDAQRQAEQLRRDGEFQMLRIRTVRMRATTEK